MPARKEGWQVRMYTRPGGVSVNSERRYEATLTQVDGDDSWGTQWDGTGDIRGVQVGSRSNHRQRRTGVGLPSK